MYQAGLGLSSEGKETLFGIGLFAPFVGSLVGLYLGWRYAPKKSKMFVKVGSALLGSAVGTLVGTAVTGVSGQVLDPGPPEEWLK